MRLITGIVFGFLLTVGAAYMHDASAPPGENMVNWEVANRSARSVTTTLQDGWRRLTSNTRDSTI